MDRGFDRPFGQPIRMIHNRIELIVFSRFPPPESVERRLHDDDYAEKSADRRRRTEGAREPGSPSTAKTAPTDERRLSMPRVPEREALAPGADFSDQTSNDIEIPLTFATARWSAGSLGAPSSRPGRMQRTSFRSGRVSNDGTSPGRTPPARSAPLH